jgi:hypothetical protein
MDHPTISQKVLKNGFPPFLVMTLPWSNIIWTPFSSILQCYDQYEDVQMNIFSLSLIGKAKEWYDNISPGEITTWDTFQDLFVRRFTKDEDCVSLYDHSSTIV